MALISALKLPADNELCSDMLPIYIIAIIFALISILLLYWQQKKNQKLNTKNYNKSAIIKLLPQLYIEMQLFEKEIHLANTTIIIEKVNYFLDNYLIPASQNKLTCNKYGMIKIVLAIALCERYLNRVWSAASDNNIQEAIAAYNNAINAAQEVDNLYWQMKNNCQ